MRLMSTEQRLRAASYGTHDNRRLIYRADALAIVGRDHPARPAIDGLPCEGNHKVGYCCGVVVDLAAVLAALTPQPTDTPEAGS